MATAVQVPVDVSTAESGALSAALHNCREADRYIWHSHASPQPVAYTDTWSRCGTKTLFASICMTCAQIARKVAGKPKGDREFIYNYQPLDGHFSAWESPNGSVTQPSSSSIKS
jgi:hypothetical protein